MSETTKILATVDTTTSAFGNSDLDGIIRTYEPTAVVVGEPGKPITGTPTLRAVRSKEGRG